MTIKTNLSIHQGQTYTATFTWLDASDDPIDLTSYTAHMQIRRDFADVDTTDPVVDITDEDSITLDAEGNIIITLADSVTESIKAGRYVYDLEVTHAGVVDKLIAGFVNVFPEVTRS